jgi:ketosteroid isomerase-like protein
MKKIVLMMVVGIFAALCACATTAPHRSRDRDLEAIGDFNRLYIKAINDGDTATLSDLTEEDIVTIQPNWKPIEGKAANDRANRQSLQLFKIKEEWRPIETVIDDELAYQRGTYVETTTAKGGGATHVSRGNFLHIYRRQKDGRWRMIREMTSTDQPVELPRVRGSQQSSGG